MALNLLVCRSERGEEETGSPRQPEDHTSTDRRQVPRQGKQRLPHAGARLHPGGDVRLQPGRWNWSIGKERSVSPLLFILLLRAHKDMDKTRTLSWGESSLCKYYSKILTFYLQGLVENGGRHVDGCFHQKGQREGADNHQNRSGRRDGAGEMKLNVFKIMRTLKSSCSFVSRLYSWLSSFSYMNTCHII